MARFRNRRRQLVSGELTIPKQTWWWRSVNVDKTAQKNHRMFGRIEVRQPADPPARKNLNIAFYIMDNDGFVDWLDLRAREKTPSFPPLNPLYTTGKVRGAEWGFETPRSGCYWLVWDNSYSMWTPKTIDIEATEEWDEMIPEEVMTDAVTTSPPVDRSLLDEVTRLIGETKSRLMVVTPYIDMEVMNQIQKKVDEGVEVYVVTRPRKDFGGDRAKAAFDYLRRTVKSNHASNSQVHARFVVSDYDKVLVSSADLSHDSLIAQYNAGLVCSEPSIVRKMVDYFSLIWANSSKNSK